MNDKIQADVISRIILAMPDRPRDADWIDALNKVYEAALQRGDTSGFNRGYALGERHAGAGDNGVSI